MLLPINNFYLFIKNRITSSYVMTPKAVGRTFGRKRHVSSFSFFLFSSHFLTSLSISLVLSSTLFYFPFLSSPSIYIFSLKNLLDLPQLCPYLVSKLTLFPFSIIPYQICYNHICIYIRYVYGQ